MFGFIVNEGAMRTIEEAADQISVPENACLQKVAELLKGEGKLHLSRIFIIRIVCGLRRLSHRGKFISTPCCVFTISCFSWLEKICLGLSDNLPRDNVSLFLIA